MRMRFALIVCSLIWPCVPAWAAAPLPTGAGFSVGFSPKGGAEAVILEGIRKAEKSIKVAAYSFTSKTIATALLDAHKRGVVVQVVADQKSNSGKYSAVTFLANQGVPVRMNGNYAIFHHKFIVFDSKHVETGSFNFSAAASTKNAENVLLLWNVPELAGHYEREWQRLWDEGTDVKPRY
jgi:phosphatidylserine/phosphatidylglycerophosphate/cardiolipin synthase-like enzyme